MNNSVITLDTIQTLLRAVLKIGGGALIAKGLADENAMEAIAAGLVALVAVVWGVKHRRTVNATPVPGADLKELHLLLALPLVAWVLVGCATGNAVAFRTETLLTDTAYGAVQVWNGYYLMEVTNRTGARAEELEQRNTEIYNASRRFAAAMLVADGIRESVSTNSAVSNKTALEIALSVGREHSSNVVWLVRSYVK